MPDNPIIITASPYGDIYRSGVIPMYLKSSSVVDPKAKYTVVSPEEAYKIAADIYIPQDSRILVSAVLRMRITTVPDITRPATITVTDGVTFISSTSADIYSAISSGTVVGTITSTDSGDIVKTITNLTILAMIRAKLVTSGTLMFGIYAANQHATSSTVLSRPADDQIEQAVGLTLTLTFDDSLVPIPVSNTIVTQAEDIVTVAYSGVYSVLNIDGTTVTNFAPVNSIFGVVRGAISFLIPHDDRVIASVSFDGEINSEITNDPMLLTAGFSSNPLTDYLGGETSLSQPEELFDNITSGDIGQINEGTAVGSISFQSESFSAFVTSLFASSGTNRLTMGFHFATPGNGSFQAILGSRPTLTVVFEDSPENEVLVDGVLIKKVSIDSVYVNGQISSNDIFPCIKLDTVVVGWEYGNDIVTQSKVEIRISNSSLNWGQDSFIGLTLQTILYISSNSYEYVSNFLTRGTIYYGQIRSTDNHGIITEWYQFSFKINRLPTVINYYLSPASPSSANNLILNYEYKDADGHDQSGTKIRWYKNNLPIAAYDDLCVLPSSAISSGEYWTAKIIPFDGIEFGSVFETNSVVISDILSSVAEVQILPLDANVDDILKVEYSTLDNEYVSFSGSTLIEWYQNNIIVVGENGIYFRPNALVGDIIYAIVKLVDGGSTVYEKKSNEVTLFDVKWHIDNVYVAGLKDPINLVVLDPFITWDIYKTTASSTSFPAYFRILITKTKSLDGPIYDTGYLEYVKNSYHLPNNILSRGSKYFLHIGVGNTLFNTKDYVTTHITTSGSSWSENVNNSTGWTIEFEAGILEGTTIGINIHDGSKFCAITFGLRDVTFLSGESIIYTYSQKISSLQSSEDTGGKSFRISGKNSDVKIFMEGNLIIDANGLLTNLSNIKQIEYGNIDPQHANVGIFRYFRYSTSGAYGIDTSLEDRSTYYFYNIGSIQDGSMDYINGNILSWTPDDANKSSKLIVFNENFLKTKLLTVNRNYSPITSIYIDERRNKYIGTANGVTAIFGEKHTPDYTFTTDSTITSDNFDRISNVPTDLLSSVEPSRKIGWFTIDTTYRNLGIADTGTGVYTGDPYDPYLYSLTSSAIHYYSQRVPGHAWFDGVDNDKGWNVSFSFSLEKLESDDFHEENIGKNGFGIYVNDGTRQEIIYFYEDRIRLFYANVYIPITTGVSRDYAIVGKKDNLIIYQKLYNSSTSSYSILANASGLFTSPAHIGGNSRNPKIAVDSSGVYHAVWHDDGNKRSRILYSYFSGQSWSYPEVVSTSMQFNMSNPSITIDSIDRIWVAYEDTSWGLTEISISVKDNGGWNPKTRLTNIRSHKGRPSISVDSNDNVHVVWEDDRDGLYKIFWSQWDDSKQAWLSSGQHGNDQPIMQFYYTSEYEYNLDDAIEFKNPSICSLPPYLFVVCEGHYTYSGKSFIFRGYRNLTENYWNSYGAINVDNNGEFIGYGLPDIVGNNDQCFNPTISSSIIRSQMVIVWEDRTEPITQIWGASYNTSSVIVSSQQLTSQDNDCNNPVCGFVNNNCAILFEKANVIYISTYNSISNEFVSSYNGGQDYVIDTENKIASYPAISNYSPLSEFICVYDYRTDHTTGLLEDREHPDFQTIGDVSVSYYATLFGINYQYTATTISSSLVSPTDTKEFAFGDFAENVGMIAHWRNFNMYFGYDAKPYSIAKYNTNTVNGWPDNRVNDLFIDAFGNVIAATFGGLVYYNISSNSLTNIEGHVEGVYSSDQGCNSGETVSCVLRTANNISGKLTTSVKWGKNGVWYVGTSDGVYVTQTAGKYWKNLDEVITGDTKISNKLIYSIDVDLSGKAYIAASNTESSSSYIYIASPNKTAVEIPMSELIKVIKVDENNIIWAGGNNGLYRIENERTVLKFDKTSGMKSSHVNDIAIVNKYLRYVATSNGIEKMYGIRFSNLNVKTVELINDNVNSILWYAPTNSLWVGALDVLHEIIFRDEEHEIVENETVYYNSGEISTEEMYDKNIYYIVDPSIISSGNLSTYSARVYINYNQIDFGYVVSESSVFFNTNLLKGDIVSIELDDQFVEFHDFTQTDIEKSVLGEKRSVINKISETSQNQLLFLSSEDKNNVLLYAGESNLPFTTITLDTVAPEGCLELLETLSRTKVRFQIYATDDRSGLDGYKISNYPNFTTDGTIPLEFSPMANVVEHDLGSGVNNTYDSLELPETVKIGAYTYSCGTGSKLATWSDVNDNMYLFAVTSAPIVIFRYSATLDTWTAVQTIEDNDTTKIVKNMESINNVVYITIGSETVNVDGSIWKCSDGLSDMPFVRIGGTPGANYATGIAGGLNQTVFFGDSAGNVYSYALNTFVKSYSNIGSRINSIDVYSTTMVVGTGTSGRIYMINLETGDTLIIFDSSNTDIHHVHIKDADWVTSPEEADLYCASSDSAIIYKANLDKLDFVKSYSTSTNVISKLACLTNMVFEQDQTVSVTGTSEVAAIGDSLFRSISPIWSFFYKHTESINDFVEYDNNGFNGIWIISDSGVTKWIASLKEKTVYLQLKDKAGNITVLPTSTAKCPDEDSSTPKTCCMSYSIQIQDLKDFIHEGKIVDVDKFGNIQYTYNSPNNKVFFSANQIDEEVGIFVSEVLNGSNDIISWRSISWVSEEPIGTNVYVQVRSGKTEDEVLDTEWGINLTIDASGEASIEYITNQYLQFRALLTSTVRNLSPSLSSITIRNLTAQASHFFTTNFVMSSRPIKGLLTANTYLPVSSDIVFGINTKNSTDFGDYQLIEPNRLFASSTNQFGSNLRIGAKLLSPSIPILNETSDPYDPYNITSFVCKIIFDYTNTSGSDKYYNFRVRLYNDTFRTQLVYTFFTGNDQTGWSYGGSTSNYFPAVGLNITTGSTKEITFEPLDEVNKHFRWYVTVDAISTDESSDYETVLDNMSYICSPCNINYITGLKTEYYLTGSVLTDVPIFSDITPNYILYEPYINWDATTSSWISHDPNATNEGVLSGFDDNFAIRFRGMLNIETEGTYIFYLTSDDGSKLFIDNDLIIDNNAVQSETEKSGVVDLLQGYRSIEVQFFSGSGLASLKLAWIPPGGEKSIVPSSALSHAVSDEYCSTQNPIIYNFIVEFELENGETLKINLDPPLS